LRYVSMMILATALSASPALSNAAPRTINDCEKIEAADAYNRCLAAFGPVAHTRGATSQAVETNDSVDADEGGAILEPAASSSSRQKIAHAHGRHRGHAYRHAWTKHGHGRQTKAADHPHGRSKRLAFTIVSSHTKLR
jgi:hypothetical protein